MKINYSQSWEFSATSQSLDQNVSSLTLDQKRTWLVVYWMFKYIRTTIGVDTGFFNVVLGTWWKIKQILQWSL